MSVPLTDSFSLGGLQVSYQAHTHAGTVRERNEDSLSVLSSSPHASVPALLAVVADGMGGHKAGKLASETALASIARSFSAGMRSHDDLVLAIESANDAVHAQAAQLPDCKGMGTTCAALLLAGDYAMAASVGDSRIYLVRGHHAYCMTEDDSASMQLVRQGLISRTAAASHPQRNMLLRALGTKPHVSVRAWPHPFPLQPGDHFVLATDGLYDCVTDAEIAAEVTQHSHAAARRLLDLSLSRMASDNVSLIVLSLVPAPGHAVS